MAGAFAVPMREHTLAFIAELADELAEMADAEGKELLSYLLRMAAMEAERSDHAEPEPEHWGTSKRISYH
jgi:hypothetical protein